MSSLLNSTTTGNATTNPNADNLFLQTLMERLQLRTQDNHPILDAFNDEAYEDYLFGEDDDDNEDEEDLFRPYQDSRKSLLEEESRLENDIIRLILTGERETLKPNSGEAIAIRDNNICVGCHVEEGGEYVVWEWHGHIMCYNDEHGFSPEYIYGNYFQRVVPVERAAAAKGDDGNQGLRDLIDGAAGTTPARILHRSLNAATLHPRT